jgi:hypothetical protein
MACYVLNLTFIKRHVMQMYGDVEIQLQVFWTLPVSGQRHNPAALPLALRAQLGIRRWFPDLPACCLVPTAWNIQKGSSGWRQVCTFGYGVYQASICPLDCRVVTSKMIYPDHVPRGAFRRRDIRIKILRLYCSGEHGALCSSIHMGGHVRGLSGEYPAISNISRTCRVVLM